METKSFALLHSDGKYAQDFAEALTQHWTNIVVSVVSSSEAKELLNVDYIITDNSVLAVTFKERGVYLYDDLDDVQSNVFSIARFQSICSIVSQLVEHCASGMGCSVSYLSFREASGTNFIGITSGSGGTGTSSLAVCIGRILSRLYAKSVLYVSFEAYKPLHYAFSFNCFGHSVDKLLYQLASKKRGDLVFLEEYISEDPFALKCIVNMTGINPLVNTEEEDIYNFLYCLTCCGKFEVIILDVPCSFLHYTSVMRMCEKQVVNFGFKSHCTIPSAIAKKELEELCSLDFEATKDRIFEFRPLSDDGSFIETDKGFDIDIHGQFGAEVRALVDKMEIR
jgi:hypothetical protein